MTLDDNLSKSNPFSSLPISSDSSPNIKSQKAQQKAQPLESDFKPLSTNKNNNSLWESERVSKVLNNWIAGPTGWSEPFGSDKLKLVLRFIFRPSL